MAGGGGGTTPAVGTPTTISSAPEGAWSHIGDPKAVYLSAVDKTVFGYVDGTSGDVEVKTYDNAAGTTSAAVTLKAAVGGIDGNPDHHDSPALLRRASDGKLVAVYSPHSSANIYRRISTSADDASSWAAETNLDSSIGGTDYTYPALLELTDESTVYLFVRDNSIVHDDTLIFSTSTDGGSTWSAKTAIYQNLAGDGPYWKICTNGTDRFDVFATDASMPTGTGVVKVYHFYYQGGSYYKTDGTALGSPPFTPSDVTLVYDGAAGRAWAFDAIWSGGEPRVLLQQADSTSVGSATTNIIREYRYRSGAWVGYDVIPDTGGLWVANISPGAVYDHANPSLVYGAKKVSGKWEMWRYRTTDDGVSWVGTAVTSASASDNLTPAYVADHGDMSVIWFYGSYTNYLSYSTGIKGLVF